MYEVIRDGLITYLIKFGIIGGNAGSVSNKLDSAREFSSRRTSLDDPNSPVARFKIL